MKPTIPMPARFRPAIHQPAILFMIVLAAAACSKKDGSVTPPPTQPTPAFRSTTISAGPNAWLRSGTAWYNVASSPLIKLAFTAPVDHSSVIPACSLKDQKGAAVPYTANYDNRDSVLILQPSSALKPLAAYSLSISTALRSQSGSALQTAVSAQLITAIDSSDKFPRISDSALLTLVQQQTFKYFWDLANPVSGLARERASGETVTTGGSGFGVMAILVGAQRDFITRQQALDRITTIVTFLSDPGKVTRYHGAFAHWLNGSTGATIPFSSKDNGGDIVETSYLIQGLLCARQYFSSTTSQPEIALHTAIDKLYADVDWNWYRQNGQNVLYWNWSPDQDWAVNVPVSGWNEALITYVLAASAPGDPIPVKTYQEGWARNGAMANGKSFYGIPLPLGPDLGGPLFLAHYSFLGIDPNGLSDPYANYWTQDTAHARINYLYCTDNPQHYYGYSSQCWGLTASDGQNGYSAHSPSNDNGVISPTAAIASLPFIPVSSMNALRFFYYIMGDKLWGTYGFTDAFNLTGLWYDTDFLAIDQGPEIVMIENYRSGLLWNLFMSCPEIRTGMKNLGFQSPRL